MLLCEFIYSDEFTPSCEFLHCMNSHSSCEFINCMNSYLSCEFIHCINSYSVGGRFPISGCDYLSLSLEQRRWQNCYCSCPGDGNVRHHRPWNTNTRIWGLRLACDHVVRHDGFRSSCCLSKSENKSKSMKEIWNKINSFFQTNFRCSMKRTDHYEWPYCSFFK